MSIGIPSPVLKGKEALVIGPLKTRAASGLKDFDLLLNEAAQRAPLGDLVDIIA